MPHKIRKCKMKHLFGQKEAKSNMNLEQGISDFKCRIENSR